MSGEVKGPFSKKEPSEFFKEAITSYGHMVISCEFCGRTYFEDDERAGDWEDGELEKLRNRAKANPDLCIGADTVRSGTIDGKTGIVGCKCNWGTKYESFIWNHRHLIMSYIAKRVKDIVERALEDEASSDQAEADLKMADEALRTVRCPKCLKFVSQIAMHEGGMCVKCWDKLAQEQKELEERQRQEIEERKRQESELLKETLIDNDVLLF